MRSIRDRAIERKSGVRIGRLVRRRGRRGIRGWAMGGTGGCRERNGRWEGRGGSHEWWVDREEFFSFDMVCVLGGRRGIRDWVIEREGEERSPIEMLIEWHEGHSRLGD